MSARLVLACVALASLPAIGCSAGGDLTEVSVSNLVLKVGSNGAIKTGSFDLRVAQPANASGSSEIRLHTLDILREGDFGSSGVPVGLGRNAAPIEVEPGAEVVTTVDFQIADGATVNDPLFDACVAPVGIFLSNTYFDEAVDAFFTVQSPMTWIAPKALTGATWAETFGDTAPQLAHAGAAFADGSSVFASVSSGPTNLLTSFVTKLDAAGTTVWNRPMALTPNPVSSAVGTSQGPSLVAAAPDGGVVVAGNLDGNLDVGGTVITSAGDSDVFFARLDATGKTIETRRFGDALAQDVQAMDVDAAGNVILVGSLAGAMDFGNGPIAPLISPSAASYYVAKLPVSGAPIYAKVPVALDPPGTFAASISAEGTVILGGGFSGKGWIGADPVHQSPYSTAFLLALAADGSAAWSKLIEGAVVNRVALDLGDVVAVMTVGGNKVIIDGHEFTGASSGTLLVARFDPTGTLRYIIPFNGNGLPVVTGLIVDSAGHALLSGKIEAPFQLGGVALDPAGRPSAFLAELERSGAPVRGMTFGCPTTSLSLAVAHSGSRDVLLVSTFEGAVDFGKGAVPTAGATDILVAKLPAQ
jgi:hypothetical protein